LKRLISALCILPPLVLIVHFGSSLHFLLLLTCVVGLGLLEFYRMLAAKGFPCWRWLGVAVGTLLPVAFYAEGITHQAIVHQAAVATIVVLCRLAARLCGIVTYAQRRTILRVLHFRGGLAW
jgi:CDP-diglyceride synthetase